MLTSYQEAVEDEMWHNFNRGRIFVGDATPTGNDSHWTSTLEEQGRDSVLTYPERPGYGQMVSNMTRVGPRIILPDLQPSNFAGTDHDLRPMGQQGALEPAAYLNEANVSRIGLRPSPSPQQTQHWFPDFESGRPELGLLGVPESTVDSNARNLLQSNYSPDGWAGRPSQPVRPYQNQSLVSEVGPFASHSLPQMTGNLQASLINSYTPTDQDAGAFGGEEHRPWNQMGSQNVAMYDPAALNQFHLTHRDHQASLGNPYIFGSQAASTQGLGMQRPLNPVELSNVPMFEGNHATYLRHAETDLQPARQPAQQQMYIPALTLPQLPEVAYGHIPNFQLPPIPQPSPSHPFLRPLAPAPPQNQPPTVDRVTYLYGHHGRPPVNTQWPLSIDISIIEICTFCPDWLLIPEAIGRAVRNGWTRDSLAKAILHAENNLTSDSLQKRLGRIQKQISMGCKLVDDKSLATIADGGSRFKADDFRSLHGLQNDLTANNWRLRDTYTSAEPSDETGHMSLSAMSAHVANWPSGSDRLIMTQCMEYARDHPQEGLDTRHWAAIFGRHGFVEPPAPAGGQNRDVEARDRFDRAVPNP